MADDKPMTNSERALWVRGHIAAARLLIERAEELSRLHGFTDACSELWNMQYAMNRAENSILEDARDA